MENTERKRVIRKEGELASSPYEKNEINGITPEEIKMLIRSCYPDSSTNLNIDESYINKIEEYIKNRNKLFKSLNELAMLNLKNFLIPRVEVESRDPQTAYIKLFNEKYIFVVDMYVKNYSSANAIRYISIDDFKLIGFHFNPIYNCLDSNSCNYFVDLLSWANLNNMIFNTNTIEKDGKQEFWIELKEKDKNLQSEVNSDENPNIKMILDEELNEQENN